MNRTLLSTAVLALMVLSGCLPYKQPTTQFTNQRRPNANAPDRALRDRAASQGLYAVVPRNRKQIAWYDVPHWLTWTFLGNERDGIFGEDTNPPYSAAPGMKSFLAWQVRNPACNFCFYVIGSGDWKTHHSFTVLQADAKGTQCFKNEKRPSVFGKGRSAVIFAFNDYKPYVSFKFPVSKYHFADFYFGWRPEGHFGIKCRPFKSVEPGV